MKISSEEIGESFIHLLILFSVIVLWLETIPELEVFKLYFVRFEAAVTFIFIIEYIIRWSNSDKPMKYPFTLMAIIDLLAILPFFIGIFVDLKTLRIVRLLRWLRIFKLVRYTEALKHLADALKLIKYDLIVFMFITVVILMISSTGIYYAEHDVQPDKFRSIPDCLWWSIVTLTTVGYGDLYPITAIGRLFSSVIMILGIGVIAVPTALWSSALTRSIAETKETKFAKKLRNRV